MPRHHVIISGTGRNGTTFLVQLLTALKLDTGFNDPSSDISEISNAGMELDITKENAPYIVKHPDLCDLLDGIIREIPMVIDHAIIPVRDLYSAAESRRAVSRKAVDSAADPYEIPGGLRLTKVPEEQEFILSRELYNLIFTLVKHDIPVTLLCFPRLVKEPEYLYKKLGFLLGEINYEVFLRCFREVAAPEKVHDFKANTQTQSSATAEEVSREKPPTLEDQIAARDAIIVRRNLKINRLRNQRKLLIYIIVSIVVIFSLISSFVLSGPHYWLK